MYFCALTSILCAPPRNLKMLLVLLKAVPNRSYGENERSEGKLAICLWNLPNIYFNRVKLLWEISNPVTIAPRLLGYAVEPVYYEHLGTNQNVQDVLISQVSLCDKALIGAINMFVDYEGVHIFKCPDKHSFEPYYTEATVPSKVATY